jgi:hypothetical protein
VIAYEIRELPRGEVVDRADSLDEAIEAIRWLIRDGRDLPSLWLAAVDEDPERDDSRIVGQWSPSELADMLRETA